MLESKDLTRADACRYARINLRAMTDWAKKGTIPAADTLYSIANFLQTTVEHLISGKPPRGINSEILTLARKITDLPAQDREEIKILLEHKLKREVNAERNSGKYPETKPLSLETQAPAPLYIAATAETEGFDNVIFTDDEIAKIPYLGDDALTAAGPLRDMFDNPGDYEVLHVLRKFLEGDPHNCFCLPVRGTSMTQAGIDDGDIVVLRLAEEPENGAIMLVSYEGQSTIKRIAMKGNRVFLQWEDGSRREEEITKEGYKILAKLLSIKKPARKA